ncbi:flagellin [Bacillus cereus]|uniref:Flagellin n=1 Tax=Bacillus luti TaxID=2026191 RepID=A0ABU8HM32_9BACI|nr:flagellin [Bacillus luti]RGN78648.1 flagellin [Bacillus cereus]
MRINTNINSMRTQEYMRQNQAKMSNSMDRLSSGKRINSASDDAAGLAIATRMRARESGLGVAANNTQDGISVIRTADSAMNSVSNILLRMRDLANQSANGTNTDANKAALDKEFSALKDQIDYISKNTEFNDKKLLDGSNNTISIQTLDSNDTNKQIKIQLANTSTVSLNIDRLGINGNPAGKPIASVTQNLINAVKNTGGADKGNAADLSSFTYVADVADTAARALERTAAVEDFITNFNAVKSAMNEEDVANISAAIDTFRSSPGGVSGNTDANMKKIGEAYLKAASPILTDDVSSASSLATDLTNLTNTASSGSTAQERTDAVKSFTDAFNKVKGGMGKEAATKIADAIDRFNKVDGSGNSLEAAQAIGKAFSDATTATSTSTTGDPSAAIKAIDEALEKIASNRATLGATLNRLDFNVNNLKSQQSSMASAASQVEDADMAKEMSEMTKFKILNEAGISMLSQANQTPQMVSKLLQ